MKIILQKEVDKLGVPGDVVAVKDGYARNFLIPKGLAVPASKGAERHAERLRRAHLEKVGRELGEAREAATRLEAVPVRIEVRAGEDGRLFGSITAADIATALAKASGLEVDRRRIRLADPIKSTGTHEVAVHLHPEVDAAVTVEVVAQ